MRLPEYLSLRQFAGLAGISRQAAWKACQHQIWRGKALIIEALEGQRGGRSGVTYRVKISSLPVELQERLKRTSNATQIKLPAPAPGQGSEEMLWWLHHLKPVLAMPEDTPERAEAIDALVGTVVLDWQNRQKRLTRSTIYRKLQELDSPTGMVALKRGGRADKGRARVLISREWDEAVPFDGATRQKIADNLTLQLRAYQAQRANRKIALILAGKWLREQTEAYGFRPNDPDIMERICRVPARLFQREAAYQTVYDYTSDRDRFDNNLPRVKRTIAGMRPMELVVADVHPVDVRIERPDGTVGSSRLMAFMDLATRRVWCELLMVEKAGGVRNTDVIKALVAMFQDEAWGVPEQLYFDNGSEYLCGDYLDDAHKLACTSLVDQKRRSRIIRAQPYNASAKPIEAWFHRFEGDHLRHVQGWHGGKLGAPKRPARGKLPAPFKGGFDAFWEVFKGHLRAYEAIPQNGQLEGDSPAGRFAKFVKSGWSATVMAPENLLTIFTKTETRIVKQHGISVDGRKWSCRELDGYFGRTVTVKVPTLGFGFNELWIGDEFENQIGIAVPDIERAYNDTRQAKHSADRKRTTAAATRAMRDELPHVDIGVEILALGSGLPIPANAPSGKVSVSRTNAPKRAIVPEHQPKKTLKQQQDEQRALQETLNSISLHKRNSA